MELLSQVTNPQILFPVAAVAVVLICAALVFIFGFHSAEQPQFDKLPLVLDDRKSSSKKRKTKEKKSSPNRVTNEDAKAKSESSKKSPAKEKKEEKVKEAEKPKPKEKPAEPRPAKKEAPVEAKKAKKGKGVVEAEKPADFDDGGWQEVPKKSDKKKVKSPEDKEKEKKDSPKKDSPAKKNNKKKETKAKDADVEAARPAEEPAEVIKVVSSSGPVVDEEAARALQAQIEEVQRVLKEAERRDQVALGVIEDDSPAAEELPEVKDLRSNKKKENMEKQIKKKEAAKSSKAEVEKDSDSEKQAEAQNAPVFDELGDSWTDAKASKKSKKKARKE